MFDKLEEIEKKYIDLTEKISDPEVISDQSLFKKCMEEHSNLTDVVEKYREYKKVKEDLVRKVTNRIIKAFPELEGQIELLDSWTPITYERYCNAYHGAYMSFVTTTTAPKLTCKGTIKNLNNFYIAGQWIMSPGGLPIAAISGKFAIQRILKKEGRSIDFE